MNSKEKAFLEKLPVKESSLEIFVATWLSIMNRLGWYSSYQSKMTKSSPIKVSPPNFYILLIIALLPSIDTWNGTLKTKNWKDDQNFQQQHNSIFPGSLKKNFACSAHFYKNLQFMTMKVCCKQKTLSRPK